MKKNATVILFLLGAVFCVSLSGGAKNNGKVYEVGYTRDTTGKVVLDYEAKKKTFHCHWYPFMETQPGGDPGNNLYALNGPLDKLDLVTGKNYREHEYDHFRVSQDIGRQCWWFGHCEGADKVVCLLQEPKKSVTLTTQNGESVIFSPRDIKGLLVLIVHTLAKEESEDIRGKKLSPNVFMAVLQQWSKDGLPFVLEFDPYARVLNVPIDRVKISESGQAPSGYDASDMPHDGSVTYYHCELSGFFPKILKFDFFTQRDTKGKVVDSDWIDTGSNDMRPHAIWRPETIGNLKDKTLWTCAESNRYVDGDVVYDIYMKSLHVNLPVSYLPIADSPEMYNWGIAGHRTDFFINLGGEE